MELVLAFTGHRPKLLGGYDENAPMNVQVKDILDKFIDDAISSDFHTFISGMALGVDLWAAEAVIERYPQTKLVAAVPFPGQHLTWPTPSQERYMHVLEKATQVVLISEGGRITNAQEVLKLSVETSRVDAVAYLNKRNNWMVDHCDAIMGILRSTLPPGGTGKCLQYAKRQRVRAIIYDLDTNTVHIENSEASFRPRPGKRSLPHTVGSFK